MKKRLSPLRFARPAGSLRPFTEEEMYKEDGTPYMRACCSIRVEPFFCSASIEVPHNQLSKKWDQYNVDVDNEELYVKEHWKPEYWALNLLVGHDFFWGVPCNLVVFMKYIRIVAFHVLVGEGVITGVDDLMAKARAIEPNVDSIILEFDEEEAYWEHTQEQV